ncbi:MAG TPA: dienelactone hydrolase family protein [Gemmatimonadaceae bacterium]|nr:dienelactone hydrolase family protein [Gemmatimonadaceae bacterium]
MTPQSQSATVAIPVRGATLTGDLAIPEAPNGIVVFAHGSGSSRLSPRNRQVAAALQASKFATLLFDLLTPAEEAVDALTGALRFDIDLLAARLADVTDWLCASPEIRGLDVGYFGASTGAAAALVAAALRPNVVRAVVSRGGRPDLAGPFLPMVYAPTLLIVGGNDRAVIGLNDTALRRMTNAKTQLSIVPRATHLFEEQGALEAVARLARKWFQENMVGIQQPQRRKTVRGTSNLAASHQAD